MNACVNIEDRNRQVAEYWSWVAKRKERGFWNLPNWEAHQNILASGNDQESWLDVLGNLAVKSVGQAGTGLSLGCGGGYLEPQLLNKKICTQIDACDISEDLITIAQKQADKNNLPIHYFQCDLNRPAFKKNKYDFIIAAGILHHIENLEALFENVRAALKPSGVFLVYDYVGPTRFQWTEKQKAICNTLLQQLPLSYRWKRGYPWYYTAARIGFNCMPFLRLPSMESLIKKSCSERSFCHFLRLKQARLFMKKVLPPPPEQFVVTDPSEAIRSEEILPLLRHYFSEKAFLPQGGTIIQPMFGRIVSNFISKAKGATLAQEIMKKERDYIQNQNLESDFVAVLLQKP